MGIDLQRDKNEAGEIQITPLGDDKNSNPMSPNNIFISESVAPNNISIDNEHVNIVGDASYLKEQVFDKLSINEHLYKNVNNNVPLSVSEQYKGATVYI